MPGEDGQVRFAEETFRVERNNLLQPACPKTMVGQADLGAPLGALEADLQRIDQAEKQGVCEEAEVLSHLGQSELSTQSPAGLASQEVRPGALAGVAASQAEELFKQCGVTSPPSAAGSQVVEDDAPDHSF